ncbi:MULTISPECIES: hypothetical protein [Brevibacillus]|uniref:hypothetical protein n=1 Tax=Brevibacillus TaxID=55080 RepID=UPI000B9C242D|nr:MULTISPECIES: hypothetical protein [Brevibacillus]MBG9789133.1 hypothetical protein [Brevibacillus laterosporus]MCG7317800.1 hypothetical protein [Brevibacillus laterosporus]MED1790294.1 hypothetical protein [Brevibacillus laterosporus]RFB32505.1 hypothetical protein DZB91_16680 [Brevibacillus sp. VP]
MNCCGNHNQGNNNPKHASHDGHGSNTHNWMMTLCCVLPIALVVLIVLINVYRGEPTNYLLSGILLICPLSNMILMPLMNKINNRKPSN